MYFHWTREFKKQYKKLPPKVQQKFQECLRQFLVDEFDPLFQNHKLAGEFSAFRSIHITGDYRAHYQHVSTELIVWAMVGTHSQLYE